MAAADTRAAIDKLLASRQSYKGKVTGAKNALGHTANNFKYTDPPEMLQNYLERLVSMFQLYSDVDDAISSHPLYDPSDKDKDYSQVVTDYIEAKSNAEFVLRTQAEAKAKKAAAAVAAQAQPPAAGGAGPAGAGNQGKAKFEITKPPILRDETDILTFLKWKPLWSNYCKLAEIGTQNREKQVAILWQNMSPGFLATVQHSLGITSNTGRTVQEILDAIERHLKSLRSAHNDLLLLLAVRQKQGQTITHLANELVEKGTMADCDNITKDRLYIALFLQALGDEDAKADLIRSNPQTFEAARQHLLAWDVSQKTARLISKKQAQAAALLKANSQDDPPPKVGAFNRKKSRYAKGREEEKGSQGDARKCSECKNILPSNLNSTNLSC